MKAPPDGSLYQRVARQMAAAVEGGLYRPGQQVPSVRRLSRELKVSISTVVQAYRLLEDWGLVEARPQSGYYVSSHPFAPPDPPQVSRPDLRPATVSTDRLALELLEALPGGGEFVQLAAAAPARELLPLRQLNRGLGALLREQASLGGSYESPDGHWELREQIAALARNAGCRIGPEQVLVTSGCQEALTLCLRAVASPGDTVAVESPTYHGILQAIESLGMRALEIPTHPSLGVCLDALEGAIRQWPVRACLFLPNFGNPLGGRMPDEHKRRLVELLARFEIPLIEDDINGDLGFQTPRPLACKAFDRLGLVLLCSSFSKTLAPGYRVGWTLPGRYTERVRHLKFLTNVTTAAPLQQAIARFLARGGLERHLQRARVHYARQTAQVSRAIQCHFPPGTRVTRPQGGFVLWVELPEGTNTLALYHRARHHGVCFAPGVLFSAQRRYGNFLRINCALPFDATLERALLTLGQLARQF